MRILALIAVLFVTLAACVPESEVSVPTARPTVAATARPAPTSAPTEVPAEAVTPAPAPTAAPTLEPTPKPTPKPTPTPTKAPTPKPAAGYYTPPGWNGSSDVDCGDFDTHAHAQSFFIGQGGPSSDPHRLDADNDGIACESLP